MKQTKSRLVPLLALIFCLGLLLKGSVPQVPSGTWAPGGSLSDARDGAAAVLLADGRVLVVGGAGTSGPLASAEIYDASGVFSSAAAMHLARAGHSATLLADGRVLVAGGETLGEGPTNSVEIYDPAGDSWSFVGALNEARAGHSASLLADGRVLIAGGASASGARASLEIYDPATESFSYAGVMSSPRASHAAAALLDGRVLIVGGSDGSSVMSSSDIYDPADGSVSAGPALASPRVGHSVTALLDGRVLVAGGSNGAEDLASAEIYDPAAGSFAASQASLGQARSGHFAFLLPHNNNVLIVGGSAGGAGLSSAELYTPWSDSLAATGAMAEARANGAGSALAQDGLLLMAGGSGLASAEAYGFATVKTDKDDYAPGEIVTITGSGWQPGESVSLVLHEIAEFHGDRELSAMADADGYIFNNEFAPEDHDVGVRFYLTASGQSSGFGAQMTFTDHAPHGTHNVNFATSGLGVATSITITGSRNNPGLGHAFTAYSVTFTSPGPSANVGAAITITSGVDAITSTLTFSGFPASVSAPGGSYNLVSVSHTSPFTIPTTTGTTTITATYTFVPANTPPTLNLPADITAEQTSAAGAVVNYSATATDAEDNPDPTPLCSPASGSTFPLGITTVNCSVTDSGGLSANGSFKVKVVDTTPPSLVAPPDITVEQSNAAGTPVSVPLATATDICDASPLVTSDAPATFPLGTTTVTFTATDASGNSATATTTVTVVDTTSPSLVAPPDITVEQSELGGTPASNAAIPAFLAGASATDICDADVAITHDAPASFPLGTTNVTFTAEDDSGNQTTATASVTVVDTTAPSVSVTSSLIVVEQAALAGTPVDVVAASGFSASDICDASLTPVVSPAGPYPLGDTAVTISVTDDSGNSASVQVTVRVRDTTAPSLSVPADLVVQCTEVTGGLGCIPASNAAIQAWLASASATDICDASVTITNNAPAVFPVGSTTVTFTATDDSGNSTSKTAKVQVVYNFAGFLPPLLLDGSASIKQQKSGRTIPVKFQLFCNGTPVPGAMATIAVFKLLNAATGTVDTTDFTADSGSSNNNTNLFRYDAVSQQYIYNLSTKGYMAPATYRIFVYLDDGTTHWVDFSLR